MPGRIFFNRIDSDDGAVGVDLSMTMQGREGPASMDVNVDATSVNVDPRQKSDIEKERILLVKHRRVPAVPPIIFKASDKVDVLFTKSLKQAKTPTSCV